MGPGVFAAVNITTKGVWPPNVEVEKYTLSTVIASNLTTFIDFLVPHTTINNHVLIALFTTRVHFNFVGHFSIKCTQS